MKTIEINQSKVVIVDDDDYERLNRYVWTYNPHGGGYASRTDRSGPKQKTVLMHREIIGAKKGQQVDHINRNRLDNRKENLRICTPGENARNASKRRDGKTSKYKGVYKIRGNFAAHIQVDNNRRFLGYYKDEMNAAYYYNVIAKRLHGEFAVFNELPENFVPTEGFSPEKARGIYSQYRGVSYDKREKKYIAQIQYGGGKRKRIGVFMTDRIAAEMYNIYAVELHGEKAILNKFEQQEGLIET